jgi:hypothetical protein
VIKLERKSDNSGWNKYNLDGTAHVDERKKSNSNNSAQIAELTKQVSDVNETVNVLIAQIQALRSDVRHRNGNR